MIIKRKIIAIISIITILGVLAGCTSPNGIRLTKSMTQAVDLKSLESQSEVTMNINAESLKASKEQKQTIEMLNSMKINIDSKVDLNSSRQYLQGTLNMGTVPMGSAEFYSDNDKMWIKIPTEDKFVVVDPAEFISKLMGADEKNNNKEKLDAMIKLYHEYQNKLRPLAINFARDLFSEYKYTFADITNKGTASVQTPEGTKTVDMIEIKVDNKEFPAFLTYTLDNVMTGNAFKDYMKEYSKLQYEMQKSIMLEMKKMGETVPNPNMTQMSGSEIDKLFKEYNANKEDVHKFIKEELPKYFELGPNGIVFTYGLDGNDNIVISDVKLNLVVKNEKTSEKVEATLHIKSTNYNFNTTTIEMPKFTKANTIALADFIETNPMLSSTPLGQMLANGGMASYNGIPNVRGSKIIRLRIGSNVAYKDGAPEQLEAAPYIDGESTMVPVRFVGESLGSKIDWDDASQMVSYYNGNVTIFMAVGKKFAIVNGEQVEMPVAPKIVNGKTMVPLRFISEQFGAKVTWDEATKTVMISR